MFLLFPGTFVFNIVMGLIVGLRRGVWHVEGEILDVIFSKFQSGLFEIFGDIVEKGLDFFFHGFSLSIDIFGHQYG